MKIIKQSAVCLDRSVTDTYSIVERCGRTCYKSEDLITADTAVKFCKAMLKNKHLAMLEHAVVYANVDTTTAYKIIKYMDRLKTMPDTDNITPYIHITQAEDASGASRNIISLSFRVVAMLIDTIRNDGTSTSFTPVLIRFVRHIIDKYPELFNESTIGDNFPDAPYNELEPENNIQIFDENEFKKYVTGQFTDEMRDKILYKHLVHTVIFTTNRGVTHELVRHRPASFAQESTRYCNYSKDKFGNELTVIEPCYYSENKALMYLWKKNAETEEKIYFEMLAAGATPQEARGNLLHDIKADLVVTATEAEWQHIVNLRYHGITGAPHPQAKEAVGIALPILTKRSDGRIK